MKGLYGVLFIFSVFCLIQCGSGADATGDDAFAEQGLSDLNPIVKNEARIVDNVNSMAVDAGFASNGVAIAIPTGFDISQCKFTAAASNIDANAISTYVSIDSVSSTTSATVICRKVVQEREETPPETGDCVASYTMICFKQ